MQAAETIRLVVGRRGAGRKFIDEFADLQTWAEPSAALVGSQLASHLWAVAVKSETGFMVSFRERGRSAGGCNNQKASVALERPSEALCNRTHISVRLIIPTKTKLKNIDTLF